MKTLHIIEPTFDFGVVSKDSQLLTSVDDDLLCDQYHTSVGDMAADMIVKVAQHFTAINFVDEKFDYSSHTFKETMIVLNHLRGFKHVTRYRSGVTTDFELAPTTTFTDLLPAARPEKPVLWVFGCSHSRGTGLLPGQKSFGEVMASELNMPLILVAKNGSSLNWSARHVVSADIKPEDIVVWQMTTPHRISRYNGKQVEEIMLAQAPNAHLLETYTDEQMFFDHINLLNFGVRYLRSLGVRFMLHELPPQTKYHYDYLTEYSKHPEFCYTPNCNLDLASDGVHFGPLSHHAIALRLVDHVKCLYD